MTIRLCDARELNAQMDEGGVRVHRLDRFCVESNQLLTIKLFTVVCVCVCAPADPCHGLNRIYEPHTMWNDEAIAQLRTRYLYINYLCCTWC